MEVTTTTNKHVLKRQKGKYMDVVKGKFARKKEESTSMKNTAVATAEVLETETTATTTKGIRKPRKRTVTAVPSPSPEERKENALDTLAQTVDTNAFFIGNRKVANVPISLLVLDPSYQRVLSAKVNKITKEWDDAKCKFLEVSFRDNRFFIIDGQHRYTAAKRNGVESIPCIIYNGLTRAQEARVFAEQNKNITRLTPYDVFKANISCGDTSIPEVAKDIKIKEICDRNNIEIRKYSSDKVSTRVLRCLSSARGRTVESFEFIIETICASNWADCIDAYKKTIYVALAAYINNNKERDKNDIHKELLSLMNTITPSELEAMARYAYPEYRSQESLLLCIRDVIADLKAEEEK